MNEYANVVNPKGRELMKNPYQNRKAIRELDDFFGRKKEIDKIFTLISSVAGPQNISIVGERRIGKSSLLYFIKSDIKKKHLENFNDYIFVYLELGALLNHNFDKFCEKLLMELSYEIKDEMTVSCSDIREKFEKYLKLLSSKGKKIVFILDEFDYMLKIPAFDSGLLNYFRGLSDRYSMSFITSSRMPIKKLTKTGESSPFFNNFHNINLKFFKRKEALELIEKPSSRQKMRFNREDINFINEVAFLHPFFIQVACYLLFDLREEENKLNGEKLDKCSYDLLFQRFYENTIDHWDFYLDHMDQVERDVLLKICEGKNISSKDKEIIDQLKNKSLIYMEDKKWKIFSSAFLKRILEKKKNRTKIPFMVISFIAFLGILSYLTLPSPQGTILGLIATLMIVIVLFILIKRRRKKISHEPFKIRKIFVNFLIGVSSSCVAAIIISKLIFQDTVTGVLAIIAFIVLVIILAYVLFIENNKNND